MSELIDKERLEEIKSLLYDYQNFNNMTKEDEIRRLLVRKHINWLIEQAERVQDLKIMLKALGKVNNRYRETLEFYADKDNYTRNFDDKDFYDYLTSVADHDGGEKARDALEGIK